LPNLKNRLYINITFCAMDAQQYNFMVGLLIVLVVLTVVLVVYVLWYDGCNDDDACCRTCTGYTGPGQATLLNSASVLQSISTILASNITGYTSLSSTLNLCGATFGPLSYFTFDCDLDEITTAILFTPSLPLSVTGKFNNVRVVPRYAAYGSASIDTTTGPTMLGDVITGQSTSVTMTFAPPTTSYVGVVKYAPTNPITRGTPIGFQFLIDPSSTMHTTGGIAVLLRITGTCVPSTIRVQNGGDGGGGGGCSSCCASCAS
jgi:hypothetical protein